jgi:hypothetical protein
VANDDLTDSAARPRTRFTRLLAVTGVALALLAVSACGEDDGDGAAGTTAAATTAAAETTPALTTAAPTTAAATTLAATTAAPTTTAAALPTIDVVEKDFAFDLPKQVPAGVVRINATNEGAEAHHAQFARLNEGVTYDTLFAAFADGPDAALPLVTLTGGPGPIQPSTDLSVTTELPAGQYVVLCFLSGADGVAHAAKGMVATVEVTDLGNESAAGDGDAQVGLIDYAFKGLPRTLPAKTTLQLTNEGKESHEVSVLKLADGATTADVLDFLTSTTSPSGPPPFAFAAGFQGVAPGGTGSVDLDLDSGTYVAICFIPSPANGFKPHAALGMIAEFQVT